MGFPSPIGARADQRRCPMTGDDMEFGVILSTYGPASPDGLRRLAIEAEDQGFDVVAISDHVTLPAEIPSTYPFSPDGEFHFDSSDDLYEMVAVLSMLAGTVDRATLMSNVCIVPYRHPVLLTKQVLTISALSDERFELGVGPGWMETEFEVLDVPFEERGSRTDEFLKLFERAASTGEIAFDGPHHSFRETGFHPIPDGEIPIWVGGHSGATFRRVAEFGDGWTIVWSRPDEVASGRERLMNAWTDYDRDGEPEVSVMRAAHLGTDAKVDLDRLLVGEPDDVLADIRDYADAGVTRLVLDFYTSDTDEQVEQIRRFGREILPAV